MSDTLRDDANRIIMAAQSAIMEHCETISAECAKINVDEIDERDDLRLTLRNGLGNLANNLEQAAMTLKMSNAAIGNTGIRGLLESLGVDVPEDVEFPGDPFTEDTDDDG